MSSIVLDPADFHDVIQAAVDAALRRVRDEAPSDQDGTVLLGKREAAAALSVSVATLDRVTYPRGDLRAVRLPGRTLYRRSTLDQWAAAREAAGD